MAEMKAKHRFPYDGKRLAVGDTFHTKSDRDATILEAAGRAERTNRVVEKEAKVAARRGRPPKYETKVESVTPAASEPKTDDDLLITRDRFYDRRDMKAEGSE